MLRDERLTSIVERIQADGIVTVDTLTEFLAISPATARRDLDVLAKKGLIIRTRGGARSTAVSFDMPLSEKRAKEAEAKTAIAVRAMTFIEPGCVVGMSGGSTVGTIARHVVHWASRSSAENPGGGALLTVVTNALDIARIVAASPAVKVVLTGGVLNPSSLELTGPFATQTMEQISLDVAFLGANGFDASGAGTVNEYEAHTNRMMGSRATTPLIVMDATKFGRRSFSLLGGTDTVNTIITDDRVSPLWRQRATGLGYTLITVPHG